MGAGSPPPVHLSSCSCPFPSRGGVLPFSLGGGRRSIGCCTVEPGRLVDVPPPCLGPVGTGWRRQAERRGPVPCLVPPHPPCRAPEASSSVDADLTVPAVAEGGGGGPSGQGQAGMLEGGQAGGCLTGEWARGLGRKEKGLECAGLWREVSRGEEGGDLWERLLSPEQEAEMAK